MQKEVSMWQVLQTVLSQPPSGVFQAAPEWCPPPLGLEEPDQEKHEGSKGISACATSEGLGGPCGV